MDFKKVEFNDIDLFRDFYIKYNKGYNNNTLGGIFAWREMLKAEYAVFENILFYRVTLKNIGIVYGMPLCDNIDKALTILNAYVKSNNYKLSFFSVLDDELELLNRYYECNVRKVGFGDYIYDFNSLKSMSGRKLHGQKNHLNYFLKNYESREIIEADKDNVKELLHFIEKVKNVVKEQNAYMYRDELGYNIEVINNFDRYKYNGIIVKVNTTLAGFVLGELIKDTVFLHIMKINKEYRGIAPFLITEYLKRFGDNIKYVNMEDDAGDEDLKYTKMCYHPIIVQDTNIVDVVGYKD